VTDQPEEIDIDRHLDALVAAVGPLRREAPRLTRWSAYLAEVLTRGGRLLVAGNGGSAAEAQHFAAELSGRFGSERRALSAIALPGEMAALTAIANDYGYEMAFARQVEAHGRPGDVLVLLSTSGRSQNLLHAARAARAMRMTTWGMTGPAPNPLALVCDDTLAIRASSPTVQELHLVAVHLLSGGVDAAVRRPASVTMRSPAAMARQREVA
jgi:phosphoheptose isomerase